MSKKEWSYVFRFLRDFSERNRKMLIQSGFLAVLAAIRPYINIVLMGFLLDAVYEGMELRQLLLYVGLALGGNLILRLAESRIREQYNQKNEYIKEIEARTIDRKALTMDYEYLENLRVQELRFRSQAEGNYIGTAGWLIFRLEQVVTAVLSIFIAIVILIPLFLSSGSGDGFLRSWWSAVLLFVLIAVMVWVNYKHSAVCILRSKKENNKQSGAYNRRGYYLDGLAGIESQKDLRIYAQQGIIENDLEQANRQLETGQRRIAVIHTRREWMARGISDISGLLVYLFTGLRAYAGVITIGGVVTYASSILRFSNAVAQFATRLADLKQVAMYCKDYAEYMDLSKRKYDGTIPLEKRRDNKFSVEFDHVSFRYPGTEQDVIHDLSLKFEIGEKMAIVGKNGSGKTTFIKLLCRLYDVTEGIIKVNGIDIRKYDPQEYCNLFAVVFQDFRIFSFKLGENLAASETVDHGRAMDALKKAGMGDRVRELPDGLNTYVGKEFADEGVAFSGGEKQKMAIARAIYKDAPFVIMDEPTAALDPVSECEVFAGFDRMVGNKTAIYISHRLASCRFCEDILVFDQGQVVQRGSHDELEKQEGLYRELWNAQAQYYA